MELSKGTKWFGLIMLFSFVQAQQFAILTVSFPIQDRFIGVVAAFGAAPSIKQFPYGSSVAMADPVLACSALRNNRSTMVAVWRGNCSFGDKMAVVLSNGAQGMLVFNTDETADGMSANKMDTVASAVMFAKSVGDRLKPLFPLTASLHTYIRPSFDPSGILLFLIASGTVLAGAYWSSAPERAQLFGPQQISESSHEAQPRPADAEEEVTYLTVTSALCFVVVASAGSASLTACAYSFLRDTAALHKYDYEINVRCLGQVNVLGIFIITPSIAMAVTWAFCRNSTWAWVLQDIMAVSLLLTMQRAIRLPNIKVSALLLCSAFLYDIFWVFLSGYFFKQSVMIQVATGGDSGEAIPMLLRMPRFTDELGGYSILGLGDIALPGLFVSFVLRFDYMQHREWTYRSYFTIASVGYMMGLIFTFIALSLMKSGQPALLYLVPSMLVPVFITAFRRDELGLLWTGPAIPFSVQQAIRAPMLATASTISTSSSVVLSSDANRSNANSQTDRHQSSPIETTEAETAEAPLGKSPTLLPLITHKRHNETGPDKDR